MSANTLLQVANVDFDSIKSNLKDFLRSQDQFQDYDFEGSNLSVLIDLLAYNTYYNAFYSNMVATESFLETAQLRESVVERAKQLGFTPTSVRGAVAGVTLSVTPDEDISSITVPKFTRFSSVKDGISYDFVTTQTETLTPSTSNSSVFTATGVELKQGTPLSFDFIATGQSPETFTIPNANVDTSLLSVSVFENADSENSEVYVNANTVIQQDGDSLIYFVQEGEDEKFELIFGDGIVGKALELGNKVTVEYIVSQGNAASKASVFTLEDNIGYSNVSITTTSVASGGSAIQSIDSIKFLAPKQFQAQNRLVTARDYATAVETAFPSFDSVQAFGGEDADPPQFGKVFISIKPSTGTSITNAVKNNIIENVLKPRSVVSITPEIIDPEFLYIIPNIEAVFNSNLTTKSPNDLRTEIVNTVKTFSDTTLEEFDAFFRYSRLLRLIDDTDVSIQNSNLEITLKRLLTPSLNTNQLLTVNFLNPIFHPFATYDGAVSSTTFTFNGNSDCFLDDQNGVLRIVRQPVTEKIVVKENTGTINYATGKLTIEDFRISAFAGSNLAITVQPLANDVIPVRNTILQVLDADISVRLLEESRLTTGSVSGTI